MSIFIDRNTFVEFGCPDETPTFLYSYADAIADGVLVGYLPPYAARTRFQRDGIRGRQLTSREPEALRQAEHLFQTLLQRAFAGELGAGGEAV